MPPADRHRVSVESGTLCEEFAHACQWTIRSPKCHDTEEGQTPRTRPANDGDTSLPRSRSASRLVLPRTAPCVSPSSHAALAGTLLLANGPASRKATPSVSGLSLD